MRKKVEIKRAKVTVYLMPKLLLYTDYLQRSGLCGNGSRSQALERLISEALQTKIKDDPFFRREYERLNPAIFGRKRK